MSTRPRRVRRAAVAAAVGLSALAALVAAGDEPEPTLHEYVAPPAGRGSADADPKAPKVIGDPPSAGQNPTAIRNGARLVPEPSKQKPTTPDEPIHGRGGFAADRDTQVRPDLSTGADGTLRYVEVFNPSVVPFKRMSALDGVRSDYTLIVQDPTRTELDVGGASSPDRDLFWGSIVLELRPGEDVPIPSVAPDMRILSYEVEPAVELVFSRDGADNYHVRSDDRRAGLKGTHRLVFLVDAPATYFASDVPKGYRLEYARRSGLLPALPDRARVAAGELLARIGIRADTPLDEAVDRLVAYFRAFEAGAPPPSTGDVYRDLALSQRGVCRHRAFAFVVTAIAAGIPARYVTNEAHAFTEIWVPERGWIRIDLGGAALELDVRNATGKQMYRPRADDPFPKPPSYADNYTRLFGDVRGLTQDQLAAARQPFDPSAPPATRDPRATDPVTPAPGPGLPEPPASAFAGKRPTRVTVDAVDSVGFRGESVRVSGRVTSEGEGGVGGLPVDVYFAPAGRGGEGARVLGQTTTAPDGRFATNIDLPKDLVLGRHEVYAATSGDSTWAPGLSE